jgi:hypothetical protein
VLTRGLKSRLVQVGTCGVLIHKKKHQLKTIYAKPYPAGFGSFLVRLVFPRRYFDIFKWFKGALAHLLTRIQFTRTSILDLLSGDIRLSCLLKDSPLNEKNRRLSLPVLLSRYDRLLFCIEITSQPRFPLNRCSVFPKPFEIRISKIGTVPA